MSLALWIIGVIGYVNTGYWGSHLFQKVWDKKKRSLGGLLCFPASFCKNCIGDNRSWKTSSGDNWLLVNDGDYDKTMAILWPIKVLLNLIVMLSIGTYYAVKTGFALITNPLSLLPKRQPKKLAKEPPKELPTGEATFWPMSNQFDIDEYHRLKARLEELEAHPDKDTILAEPRRF
jgi:hypothetical protein